MTEPKPLRRILAVAHDNSGSRILFERVRRAFPDIEFGLAITEGLYYKKSTTTSIYKLLREASTLFCAVRAMDMLAYRLRGDTLSRWAKRHGGFWFRTRDINDDHSLEQIKAFKPELILSLYTMHIYGKEVLAVAPLGGIGTHPSILPDYRGLEVFFWAMVNNESWIGVSVFTMETKLDRGKVLNEVKLMLEPDQSMASVYRMITEEAGDLLVESIEDIRNGRATYRIPRGEGRYFPMPTRAAVRRFRQLGKRFF